MNENNFLDNFCKEQNVVQVISVLYKIALI